MKVTSPVILKFVVDVAIFKSKESHPEDVKDLLLRLNRTVLVLIFLTIYGKI